MLDEIVKPETVIPELQEKKFVIYENQPFKIQIVLSGNIIRDEFTGCGPEPFEETLEFAKKICRIYKGSKVRVSITTRHKQV
jgi:hypothetical protein